MNCILMPGMSEVSVGNDPYWMRT